MLNKLKEFPENVRTSVGLVSLTIIIFFTFFVLNIFYGPDKNTELKICLLYTSPSPRDGLLSRMPSSA